MHHRQLLTEEKKSLRRKLGNALRASLYNKESQAVCPIELFRDVDGVTFVTTKKTNTRENTWSPLPVLLQHNNNTVDAMGRAPLTQN